MPVDKILRLTCFHCENRLELPVRQFRSFEKLNKALMRNEWIFGVESPRAGVAVFDPLCSRCGRETIKRMLEQGELTPDAEQYLRKIYPDLFNLEQPN